MRWSSNPVYPNNGLPGGAVYDVTVEAVGSAYTIDASTLTLQLDSLLLNASAATVNIGSLTANNIEVDAGTLFAKSISSATISATNGGFLLLPVPSGTAGTISVTNSTIQFVGSSMDLSLLSTMSLSNAQVLLGAAVTNSGGVLAIMDDRRTISLAGGSITGGTISSPTGAALHVVHGLDPNVLNSRSTLSHLTLQAPTVVEAGGSLDVDSVDNRGGISVQGSSLTLLGTWTNPGGITVNNGSLALFTAPADLGPITLTHSSLYLKALPTAAQFAAVQRTDSDVHLGNIDLAGNTVTLDKLGTWYLDGTVRNGTIRSTADNPLVISLPTIDNITFQTPVVIPKDSILTALHSFTLDHSQIIIPGTTAPYVPGGIDSPEIDGVGEIDFDAQLEPNGLPPMIRYIDSRTSLTVASGITVRARGASGNISSGSGVQFNGVGLAENGFTLYCRGSFTNNGTLQADSGGQIAFIASSGFSGVESFNNLAAGVLTGGKYEVYDASSISLINLPQSPQSIVTNNASILLSGRTSRFDALNALAVNQGSLSIEDGRNFTTIGTLSNTGLLTVGPGSQLAVNGDLSESATSVLEITIGYESGILSAGSASVLGNVALDGTLRVSFADGYSPSAGETFSLSFLRENNVSGNFSSLELPTLPNGESWFTDDIAAGRLTVVPEPGAMAILGGLAACGLLRRKSY